MSTEQYNWLSTSRQTQSLSVLTLSLLEDFAYLALKQNYGNCILNKKNLFCTLVNGFLFTRYCEIVQYRVSVNCIGMHSFRKFRFLITGQLTFFKQQYKVKQI